MSDILSCDFEASYDEVMLLYAEIERRYPYETVAITNCARHREACIWLTEQFGDGGDRWCSDFGLIRFLDQKDAALFMLFWP